MTIMMRAPWTMMAALRMASERRLAMTRRASSSSPATYSTAAVSPININEGDVGINAPDSSFASNIEGLVTVRIVSINDVYDLTKLPRLATFLRTLGSKIDDQPNESNGIDKNSDGSLRDVGTTTNESNNNCNTNGEHRFDPSIRPSAVTLNGDFVAASTLSSIDGGRGHVASVRSCGVTHVCLGNHEADIPLSVLKMRLEELTARSEGGNGRGVVVLNSNVNGLVDCSKRFDVISSNCGRIRLGLIGLLSDERGMFPAGTFRGLQIFDVRETMRMMDENIVAGGHADLLVPLTRQSINADIDLARSMLEVRSRRVAEDDDDERDAKGAGGGVILGGHEHIKIHERVAPDDDTFDGDDGGGDNRGVVEIIKSGQNSERAAVVDLRFDPTTRELVDANVHFEELDERHPLCPVADSVVKSHLAVLERMRNYVVFNAQTMLADYFRDPSSDGHLPLSSEFTRYEQTTVGALFCTAVKIELGADVCVINGAPIKASKTYVDGIMSYDDLRNELPFPLKMVVVEMTRGRLREAIEYSRTNLEEGKPSSVDENSKVERRGYLQTDFDYWKTGEDCNEDDNEILTVALPRNLLNGFCKIKPLMDFRSELESKHSLPDEDSYAKAIDLIVRYCLDDRWATIAQRLTFADLDMNKDGKLSRDEIRDAIRLVLREEASDALLDGMIDAIDNDQNGFIDENEFNLLLAKIRSQTWNL